MRSVQAAFSYAQHGRDDQERGDALFSRETLNRHAPRALHTVCYTGADSGTYRSHITTVPLNGFGGLPKKMVVEGVPVVERNYGP